ncbi:GNAT family N-acetyltransferase [Parabacteroides sp. OttesenSCG-928-N08]|nr:GNAT family N-acetyltransferase [Parabacteroides sp. OttesenSCG-928-N08]
MPKGFRLFNVPSLFSTTDMSLSSKEKYRALCLEERSIPIFSRDWWLDVVCGEENWEVLLVEEKERIVAAMPLYLRSKQMVTMPAYTQTMGPWFASPLDEQKYTGRLSDLQRYQKKLLAGLVNYPYFLQNFHHSVTDWLPFYWAGYKQTTRYTYLLPDISDMELLWKNMSSHTRREITHAGEKHHITVRNGVSTDDFIAIQRKTFERQGKEPPHLPVLKRLIEACRQRGQGDIWGGYDEQGQLHAAVFAVWQESCAYNLAAGGDPQLRHSGAHALVLWRVIQSMAQYTRQFDFEGSMLPGVEIFFRNFGSIQKPYFTISKGKVSLWYRGWLKATGR